MSRGASFQYIIAFAFGGDGLPDAGDFGGYLVGGGDVIFFDTPPSQYRP